METEVVIEDCEEYKGPFALPAVPQLAEDFGARLSRLCAQLAKHPKCPGLLTLFAKNLRKTMAAIPELEPAVCFAEEAQKQLFGMLTALLRAAEEPFTPNDFFAFFKFEERRLLFRGESRLVRLNLPQFVCLVREFCANVEHAFAWEAWTRLDLNFAKMHNLTPVICGAKFKGLSLSFFWRVQVAVQRILEVLGRDQLVAQLSAAGLAEHFHEHFGLASLKKVVARTPEIRTKTGALFRWVPDFDPLTRATDCVPDDLQVYANFPLFHPHSITQRLENKQRPTLLRFEDLPASLAQPSEKAAAGFPTLIASGLLRHPDFVAFVVRQMEMHLRLSTRTTLQDDRLGLFSPLFPLKRLTLVNLRKANCHLLYKLAGTQPLDLYDLSLEHLVTRQPFRDHLLQTLRLHFHTEEADLDGLPDDAKRLNRRFSRIFDRAFGLAVDHLSRMFLAFHFERGARLAFLSKTSRSAEEAVAALGVWPAWKTLKLSEAQSRDPNFGWFDKWNSLVVDLDPASPPRTATFTFWRGSALYSRFEAAVTRVNFDSKTLDLSCDLTMAGVVTDFQPNAVLVVANSPEAYFLLTKVSGFMESVVPDLKKGQSREPIVPLFLCSPFLEAVAAQAPAVGWDRAQFYNCYLQSPLLAFLSVFRDASPLTGLFDDRHLHLASAFGRFLLKQTVLQSVFEKGLHVEAILNSPLAAQALTFLGLARPRHELQQLWAEMKVNYACGSRKVRPEAYRSWFSFSELSDVDPAFVLFRKAPSSEGDFVALSAKFKSLPPAKIVDLSKAYAAALDSATTGEKTAERVVFQNLHQNVDLLASLLFAHRLFVDAGYLPNPRVTHLSAQLNSAECQWRTLRALFPREPCVHELSVAQMRVTEVGEKFVQGSVGRYFHGSLFFEDVTATPFKELRPSLANYFSVNEVLEVVVKKVHPALLRLDVSVSPREIRKIAAFAEHSGILDRFGLKRGGPFVLDERLDVPLVAAFEKTERNFDHFPTETPLLKNWTVAEAKARFKAPGAPAFVFRPSPRGKLAYFELVAFFARLDCVFTLPVSQMIFDASAALRPNEKPLKYAQIDLEGLHFGALGFSVLGLSAFVRDFAEPLIAGIVRAIELPQFNTESKDALLAKLKVSEAAPSEEPAGAPPVFLARNPAEDFTFLFLYKDAKGKAGAKVLRVTHDGFELLAKFESLAALLDDFAQNWRDEKFAHPEAEADDKVVSISDDVLSVVSTSLHELPDNRPRKPDSGFNNMASGDNNNFGRRDGGAFGASGFAPRGFHNQPGEGGFRNQQGEGGFRRPFGQRDQNGAGDGGFRRPFGQRDQNGPSGGFRGGFGGNNTPGWGINSQSAPTTTNAPSWGGSSDPAQVTNTASSWGGNTEQTETSNAAPAWGGNAQATETTNATTNAAPSWGGTTEAAPSWGDAPATDPPKPQGESSGSWGAAPATGDNNAFGGGEFQGRPPRRDNDFRPRREFGDGQGGFNRDGPRQFNGPPRNNLGGREAGQGGSWGNSGASEPQTAPAPSWGGSDPKVEQQAAPSWGQPAEETKTDAPAPAWGQSAPAAEETAAPATGGWGGQNNSQSFGSGQGGFRDRGQRPEGGFQSRTRFADGQGGQGGSFGRGPGGFNRDRPHRDNNFNRGGGGSQWGGNNAGPAPDSTAPAWGNSSAQSAAPIEPPAWGATPEANATPTVPFWGAPAVNTDNNNSGGGSWGGNQGGGPRGGDRNNFGNRESGYQGRRDGNFGNREGGFQGNRDGGFQGRRDSNFGNRDGGFQGRRDGGFGGRPPRDGNSFGGERRSFNNFNNSGSGGGWNSNSTLQADTGAAPSWGNSQTNNPAPEAIAPSWGNTQAANPAPEATAPAWGNSQTTNPAPETAAPAWGAPETSNPTPGATVAPSWGSTAPDTQATGGWESQPAAPNNESGNGGWGGNQGGFNRGPRNFGDRPPRSNFQSQGGQRRDFNNNGGGFSNRGDRGGFGNYGDGGWRNQNPGSQSNSGGWGGQSNSGGGGGQSNSGGWGAQSNSESATVPESAPTWGSNDAKPAEGTTTSEPAPPPAWGDTQAKPAEEKKEESEPWDGPREHSFRDESSNSRGFGRPSQWQDRGNSNRGGQPFQRRDGGGNFNNRGPRNNNWGGGGQKNSGNSSWGSGNQARPSWGDSGNSAPNATETQPDPGWGSNIGVQQAKQEQEAPAWGAQEAVVGKRDAEAFNGGWTGPNQPSKMVKKDILAGPAALEEGEISAEHARKEGGQ